MTQPPQPLQRTPKDRPTPVAQASAIQQQAASRSSSAAPKIDPSTLGAGAIRPSLGIPREKILLAGDSNSGKSFAWIQIAQQKYESEADLPAAQRTRFFIIDTDDTVPTFCAEGREFDYLYYENGGNIYPFYAPDWPTIARAANYITRESKRDDWIIVDLASSAYMLAQEYIAELRGLNLDDEVVRRMVGWGQARKQGFGAFDGDTWGIVSRTYEASIRPLVNSPKGCHFIGLAHVTDMQTTAGRETREPILLFDQLGMKPTGVGKLVKLVNTVAVLWSVRPLDSDNRSSPKIVRNMTVVKDRGEACHYTRPFASFYEDLRTFRRTVTKTVNVVDEQAAAAATAAARAAITAPAEDDDAEAAE